MVESRLQTRCAILQQIHSTPFTFYTRMRAHMVANLYACIWVYKHVAYTTIAQNIPPPPSQKVLLQYTCTKMYPSSPKKKKDC
jgi:hypothetical protein